MMSFYLTWVMSDPPPPPLLRVMAASSVRPAEMLKPDYEGFNHYRCDFSRQERALRDMDFLRGKKAEVKVV